MNVGGAEVLVMNLYRHIDRTKVSFDFAVQTHQEGYFDKEISSLGGNVWRHSKPRDVGSKAYLKELRNTLLTKGPFDVVHSHVYYSSGAILALAKLCGVPMRIAHSHSIEDGVHNSPARELYRRVSRLLILRTATHLFACSSLAGQSLYGRGFLKDPRSHIIHNSIDLSPFESEGQFSNIREQLCIPQDALVLGHVGRFVEQKNHAFLIEIVRRLRTSGVNVHAILAGDGPLRSRVEQQSAQAAVRDRLHFLGMRSDVYDVLNAIDVFVFPSLYEGLGIAVVEAQASGKPCVVSTGVPEEVDMGLGLVRRLPLDSPSAWIEAVIRMANVPRIPANRRVEALRVRGYDVRRNAKKIQEVYLTRVHKG
ncbi:glycosyltransferase family 1 protein [Alicyclobacillus herbarius]|uniref:glycosyltransferase family 1 protein n=1 Tax=Alicyclobacillus herbarius TaxID=122960 RepID=UPI003CCBDE38